MESKKTEPESNDADVKEGSVGDATESESIANLPVVEQIDDSELPQSIKDQYRKQPDPDLEPESGTP